MREKKYHARMGASKSGRSILHATHKALNSLFSLDCFVIVSMAHWSYVLEGPKADLSSS